LQGQTQERLEKLFNANKELLHEEFTKVRETFSDAEARVDNKALEINRGILDIKYWIDQYNESFKQADGKFNNVRTELLGEIEQL
jgi:hypothetical protein